MNKDNGGPAFPFPSNVDAGEPGELGMTLRDYLAAHATEEDIKALRSSVPRVTEIRNNYGPGPAFSENRAEPKNWRQVARYLHADLMLKARNQ